MSKTTSISKNHTKCQKCQHKDVCDEKRMMACAVANLVDGEDIVSDVSISVSTAIAMPVIDTYQDELNRAFKQDIFNQITGGAFQIFGSAT